MLTTIKITTKTTTKAFTYCEKIDQNRPEAHACAVFLQTNSHSKKAARYWTYLR